jgi:hypothetical protein
MAERVGTLPLPFVVKMPFVPVPRRNPETSRCEVRKSVRDPSGVPKTLEVVAVVKGVARAQGAIDGFTKHLTEEEKKSGIFFGWEYTSRLNRAPYLGGVLYRRVACADCGPRQ